MVKKDYLFEDCKLTSINYYIMPSILTFVSTYLNWNEKPYMEEQLIKVQWKQKVSQSLSHLVMEQN